MTKTKVRPLMSKDAFAKMLREKRISLFMTQPEMSEKLGVSLVTVNRWERGLAMPTLKNQSLVIEILREKGE